MDVLFLHFKGLELECCFCELRGLGLMSFGVFAVFNRISMKTSFGGDVFNSWVGFFVLRWRAVEDRARLSGVASGAGWGFPLCWGHRRLFFELERWAPLLGSLLLICPNREHEQYENGNESRHLILQ